MTITSIVIALIGLLFIFGSVSMKKKCKSYDDDHLYPCCASDYNIILCFGGNVEDKNMKYLFQNINSAFKFLLTPRILIIRETNLTTIGSIDYYSFDEIVIDNNQRLEYISFDLFNSSINNLNKIQILNNPLLTIEDKGSGTLFESLNKTRGLTYVTLLRFMERGVTGEFDYKNSPQLKIALKNNNLKLIPDNAFNNIVKMDSKFSIITLTNNSIESIGSYAFSNLSEVTLIAITKDLLTTLKSYAFNNIEFTLRNSENDRIISAIDLSQNKIEIIESYAFNNLSFVSLLNLSHNRIENIQKYSFYNIKESLLIDLKFNRIKVMEDSAFNIHAIDFSTNRVVIDLSHTQFKSESFSANSFNTTNATLIFRSNNWQTLKQDLFQPFFEMNEKNILDLRYNDFKCDCSFKWILEIKNTFEKIKGLFCPDRNIYIQRSTQEDFMQCN